MRCPGAATPFTVRDDPASALADASDPRLIVRTISDAARPCGFTPGGLDAVLLEVADELGERPDRIRRSRVGVSRGGG
jgi:hypothetical protein